MKITRKVSEKCNVNSCTQRPGLASCVGQIDRQIRAWAKVCFCSGKTFDPLLQSFTLQKGELVNARKKQPLSVNLGYQERLIGHETKVVFLIYNCKNYFSQVKYMFYFLGNIFWEQIYDPNSVLMQNLMNFIVKISVFPGLRFYHCEEILWNGIRISQDGGSHNKILHLQEKIGRPYFAF